MTLTDPILEDLLSCLEHEHGFSIITPKLIWREHYLSDKSSTLESHGTPDPKNKVKMVVLGKPHNSERLKQIYLATIVGAIMTLLPPTVGNPKLWMPSRIRFSTKVNSRLIIEDIFWPFNEDVIKDEIIVLDGFTSSESTNKFRRLVNDDSLSTKMDPNGMYLSAAQRFARMSLYDILAPIIQNEMDWERFVVGKTIAITQSAFRTDIAAIVATIMVILNIVPIKENTYEESEDCDNDVYDP